MPKISFSTFISMDPPSTSPGMSGNNRRMAITYRPLTRNEMLTKRVIMSLPAFPKAASLPNHLP